MYSNIVLALLAFSSGGNDQPVALDPPAQPAVIAANYQDGQGLLRAGAEIPLVTREELTTKKKKLRVGTRIQLEVASNIVSNGVTVIPAGSPAIAEITEVRNKGMWGKSGYIGARIVSLRLGDRQVRLSGTFDDKGVTGTGGVVAAAVLLPLAGFITTGTSANIPIGSAVKAFLDEDINFRYDRRPLTVAAPVVPQPQD